MENKLSLSLSLTWVVDLLADESLRIGASGAGYFTTACVDTPALAYSRVALLGTEPSVIGALRHVGRRSMLLTSLDLLPMALAQYADTT